MTNSTSLWVSTDSCSETIQLPLLAAASVEEMPTSECAFFDLRPATAFTKAFLPGSISLPHLQCLGDVDLDKLINGRTVFFIANKQELADEAAAALRATGKDRVAGWLGSESLDLWRKNNGPLGAIEQIEPETLAIRLAGWKTILLDVRDSAAFESAHIAEALSIPLACLTSSLQGLPLETPISIICNTGNKSSLAASLLWNLNYRNLAIVRGGFQNYIERSLAIVTP